MHGATHTNSTACKDTKKKQILSFPDKGVLGKNPLISDFFCIFAISNHRYDDTT